MPFILVTAIGIVSAVALARNEEVPDDCDGRERRRPPVRLAVPLPARERARPRRGRARVRRRGRRAALRQLRPSCTCPSTSRSTCACAPTTSSTRSGCRSSGRSRTCLPGQVTTLVITPTKVGEYEVLCTELCGLGPLGHALGGDRRARRPTSTHWKREAGRQTGGGGDAGAGRLRAERLRELPRARGGERDRHDRAEPRGAAPAGRSARASRWRSSSASRSSQPDAYVEEGFTAGVMPKTYAEPARRADRRARAISRPVEQGGGSR